MLPRYVAIALSVPLFLAACGSEPPAPRAVAPSVVRGVALATVRPVALADRLEVVGSVKSRSVTTIASKILARVKALHVAEGSRVQAGELLIELDDRDILAQVRRAEAGLAEAEGALAEVDRGIAAAKAVGAAAQAQRDLADTTLARYQRLLDRRSVAPAEYDQVVARAKAATAELERTAAESQAVQAKREQALARIESARAEIAAANVLRDQAQILAPFAGVVTAKQVEVGTLAAPGAPLLTLEDSRRYWLDALVPDSQLASLRPGQDLPIAVESAGITGTAPISEVLPVADPTTRTTVVRLDLPASPRLRSGLFGRVWVPTGGRQALLVPQPALVTRGQLEGVYVIGQDSLAHFRLVRTGASREQQIEILAGLADGEQIVVTGAERVTDGAKVEPRP
ncbi:MAG TPA: efflux RND transporter periplasmic adaptor subunit [Candidatus Sulfotelmatobacter sp.]|nr:efflux RND transporter periplasmic adaptor subunit [Candidatus Sulfotelmatobacter sp.]